jgi:hypothetical protein
MKALFITFLLFFVVQLFAQQNIDSNYIYSNKAQVKTGNIVYHESNAIKALMVKNLIVNQTLPEVPGFRIQIFSVSGVNSKEQANKVKVEFLAKYPTAAVYILYQAPYFKVRIGDFRTEIQAHYFFQQISPNYPYAFVVEDYVNIPYVASLEIK